jgi:hypothetical protein
LGTVLLSSFTGGRAGRRDDSLNGMRRSDDEALSWDGDDDPTLDVGTAAPVQSGPADAGVVDADTATADAPDADASRTTAVLPEGYIAVGRGSDAVGRPDDRARADDAEGVDDERGGVPVEREPMGNATLITLGILGGVYLLFAIGWAIGGLRLQGRAAYLVTDIMFQGSFWLAVLSPLLWFATVFLLTAGARAWVRIVWLVAGAALLLPWPFVMIGAVGQ